mmetsp:Transcript_65394/g.147530  ORF Transcript_65394/g.147530 Transcript_65394/m.147530 type:complete len:407 (-) Transcript_65394:181-1401(-)|eukprot:CAMPEP_0172636558 /NCGR_PEP_ID=MMETSP1068-20121228/204590_1 /TAXON_ID=35684 /ORGANISM="Pseudopedinella elastica, Strain CCMP716" /LENGTH=406 /DNA_ID=CAMNT_0013449005 /DNA_START=190 /DNA_END=1410 /DNA_ORIENTATION=-
MEPKAPIQMFDRYNRSEKPLRMRPGVHASRLVAGELIDETLRPARPVLVSEGSMGLFHGSKPCLDVAGMVATARAFEPWEREVHSEMSAASRIRSSIRSGATPVRPLSCPGLSVRKHRLISTPSMGLRPPQAQGRVTLPLPEWHSPSTVEEFAHSRPFDSAHAFDAVVGGALPDSHGIWTVGGGKGAHYSKHHALQSMESLCASPHRPTEWAHKNVHGRNQSYRRVRLARVKDLPEHATRLFVPKSKRFESHELAAADAIKASLDSIKSERRGIKLRASGLTPESRTKQAKNREQSEQLRLARIKEVADHVSNHDDKVLAYRVTFDLFDADKSGDIDMGELKGALRHMGLEVGGDEGVKKMLGKYDANGDGVLSYLEFCDFAKDAALDPDSESIFIRKTALQGAIR